MSVDMGFVKRMGESVLLSARISLALNEEAFRQIVGREPSTVCDTNLIGEYRKEIEAISSRLEIIFCGRDGSQLDVDERTEEDFQSFPQATQEWARGLIVELVEKEVVDKRAIGDYSLLCCCAEALIETITKSTSFFEERVKKLDKERRIPPSPRTLQAIRDLEEMGIGT